MSEPITILGGGSWGMAIAHLLDRKGLPVTLWEHFPEDYEKLLKQRSNPDKLPDLKLADSIRVSNDLDRAVKDATLLVVAVPSQFVRSVLTRISDKAGHLQGVVSLSKGIEKKTLKRMSEVILDETSLKREKIIAMSGPSHAEEVVQDMPTTVVAAGSTEELVTHVQELFSDNNFRVYLSHDLVGVELGGSLKNIIAIAAGIADGLGMGDNTKGALMTRGMAEITRLGISMGADPETFAGLSGMGDLVTTCISRHSRNRWVGERIGRGEKLEEILGKMKMVAEGVETTRSGYQLARLHDVEMPITEAVYNVLFENVAPAEAVGNLMGRTLKPEIWQ